MTNLVGLYLRGCGKGRIKLLARGDVVEHSSMMWISELMTSFKFGQ